MEKPKYSQENYEPTNVAFDYVALKECMKDAIKEALLYERKRRERAIGMYVLFMIVFGAIFLYSALNPGYGYRSIQTQSTLSLISLVGLGATQVVFSIWALTRWF